MKHELLSGKGWGVLFLFLSSAAMAQTVGTLSSYSRFGLGLLCEQSPGWSRSMGGAGIGVRASGRINTANPASLSAIDSLSLIFDIGMSGSFGRMRQGTRQEGVNNASLDYVQAGMRIGRNMGLAVGYMPYTSIGYKYASPEEPVAYDAVTTLPITSSISYSGSGGLNQAFVSLGWKAYGNVSVGASVGFLWGKYEHSLVPVFAEGGSSTSTYSSTVKSYEASLRTFKADLGVQYPFRLTRQDWLNLGATLGIGHRIAQDATLLLYSTRGDTTTYTAHSPFDLPYSIGYGASWQHKNTLLVAADARHELWSRCRVPTETADGYVPVKGGYRNRTSLAVGAQYTPNPYGKYWERVQYRAGINYATPYLQTDGAKGPGELRLGIGAGLPIQNRHSSRSVVNVGVQWLRRSASAAGMVKEDYLVINLGMVFNERWFMKYKIE